MAANLAVVGIILLLSEPEDVTKFETAAGATIIDGYFSK